MDFKILIHVLEDSEIFLDTIRTILVSGGFSDTDLILCKTLDEFDKEIEKQPVEVAIIDVYLRGQPVGIQLLRKLKKLNQRCCVTMISGRMDGWLIANCRNYKADKILDKYDDEFKQKLIEFTHDHIDERRFELQTVHKINEVSNGA